MSQGYTSVSKAITHKPIEYIQNMNIKGEFLFRVVIYQDADTETHSQAKAYK